MTFGMQMQKPLNLLAYAAIYPDHQVIKEKLSFLTLHKLRFFAVMIVSRKTQKDKRKWINPIFIRSINILYSNFIYNITCF